MKNLSMVMMMVAAAALLPAREAAQARGGATADEAALIQILASDRTVAEKDTACVQLLPIGTDRSIPALAALLGDPRLSHSARHVLEAMSSPAAGGALIGALESTSGAERLGIVGSLGARREPQAVPALSRLLAAAGAGTPDTPSAVRANDAITLGVAAAAALGQIDDRGAIAALEQAWMRPVGLVHDAAADALLRQTHRQLAAGAQSEARRLFGELYERETNEPLRLAAFQGVIRAAGDEGLRQLIEALAGSSPGIQLAALRLVPDFPVAGAGGEFARLLPKLSPPLQVALLNAWTQRPEPPPLATVAPLLDSPSLEVKLAAVHTLARVGDASVVAPLVEIATVRGPMQDAARLTLAEMGAADVPRRLMALLDDSRPDVQVEAVRALGERGEKDAIPAVLRLAHVDSTPVRQAALRALVVLVDEQQLGILVRLVVEATGDSTRAEAARAVALASEKFAPAPAASVVQPLLDQLARGTPETRVALLPVCRSLALPEIRDALRAALAGNDAPVRAAAVHATALTVDPALLSDLTTLACSAPEPEFRDLGTKGCVRLIAAAGGRISTTRRVEVFRAIAAAMKSPAQKRALLTGLSAGQTLAELQLAESLSRDAAVGIEAVGVVLTVAPRVGESVPTLALLERMRTAARNPAAGRKIEAARRNVRSRAEFVTSWQAAAFSRPVSRSGLNLLDTPFAPETKADDFRVPAARMRLAGWEPMAAGTNAAKPMLLRGGGPTVFSVTYAYTWLRSPRAQSAQLEVLHDSGIKVWCNGELALAAPASVPLPQAQPEKARVTLRAGWNLLRVKIGQPAKGWSFSVRVKNEDGAPLPEVTADAAAEPGA